jgi:hypothetical protein
MGRVGVVWYNTRSLVLNVLLRGRQALLRRMGMMLEQTGHMLAENERNGKFKRFGSFCFVSSAEPGVLVSLLVQDILIYLGDIAAKTSQANSRARFARRKQEVDSPDQLRSLTVECEYILGVVDDEAR